VHSRAVADRESDLDGRLLTAVSVVAPFHNEVQNLPIFWDELRDVLDHSRWNAEIIFVDDGSADGSTDLIRAIVRNDPRVRLLRLRENRGLSSALAAGLAAAGGDIVVTLDTDLQNDPRDIVRLMEHLGAWDVACGWRVERQDRWLKRLSSRVANGVRMTVLGDGIHDCACTLRAMHRRCLADIVFFDGFHRFVPSMLRAAGHRVLEVPVNHRPRRFGTSHYGLRNRLVTTFADMLAMRVLKSRRLRYELAKDE
jgi:glycosyltransferase involved in cell wall biosynthesis